MATNQTAKIVKFCRFHDWGRNAEAIQGEDGKTYIGGIIDQVCKDGKAFEPEIISLPANIHTIRDWAGY